MLANVPLDSNQGSGYVILGHAEELRRRGHEVEVRSAYPKKSLAGGRGNRFRIRLGMARAISMARTYDFLCLWGGEAGWVAPKVSRLRRRGTVIACSNGLETHSGLASGDLRRGEPDFFRLEQCFRDLDGLMVVSRFDRDFAAEENYQPPERMAAVSNPIPSSFVGQTINL
ncbi:MAG TPA: hypothetical protein VMI31_06075, partial [Fimbriimonadaceae bacterium]|nr:hypothetical protein [Fimbriimonadaceae bacterium]